MIEGSLIKLILTMTNHIIERAHNDPIAKIKIQNGQKLTIDDLQRLGVARDEAGDALDAAIADAEDS